MENSKRRRGISLSHQQNTTLPTQTPLDKSVYVEPQQTTRLQYPRYHLQSPSRHASAPKAKVQFAYPVHITGPVSIRPQIRHIERPQESFYIPPPTKFVTPAALVPPTPTKNQPPQEQKMIQSLPLPITLPEPSLSGVWEKEEPKMQTTIKVSQNQSPAPIPEKYASFEQCKQVISKRLFGAGCIVKRESILQQSDRNNRWHQEVKQEIKQDSKSTISQTSIIEECVKELAKASEVAPPPPPPPKKRQLNIQHQVVNYAAENKAAKENTPPVPTITVTPPEPTFFAPPTPVKKERKGRDPMKLQEMEKRLMEIIKICDENLS